MTTIFYRMLKARILIVPLLFVTIFLPISTVSASENSVSQNIEDARQSGLAFLASVSPHWQPGWTNTKLVDARPVHGLEDEPVGYQFAVKQGSVTVGTLIMGGETFSYQPLELVAVAPWKAPNGSELSQATTRDLDSTDQPKPSDKLLYLGYQRMFEVYEVGGQEVAFDLVNRTMRLKAELRNYLSSPIERRNSNSRDTAYWSAWEVIAGVPLYGLR